MNIFGIGMVKIRQDASCLKSIFVEWRGLQTSRYSHGSFYINDSMKRVDAFSFSVSHMNSCEIVQQKIHFKARLWDFSWKTDMRFQHFWDWGKMMIWPMIWPVLPVNYVSHDLSKRKDVRNMLPSWQLTYRWVSFSQGGICNVSVFPYLENKWATTKTLVADMMGGGYDHRNYGGPSHNGDFMKSISTNRSGMV